MSNPLERLDFNSDLKLSSADVRELLAYIEGQMQASPVKMEIPVEHHFSKDVYAREMRVPKGTLLMGKIHRFQNMNILSAGEVSVLSVDGVKRVKAPFTFVASPGSKRLFYMHEDTVWTTIHGTDLTEVDAIESVFIAKSYDDLYLTSGRTLNDALSALGYTQVELTAISENQEDLAPFAESAPRAEVKPSPIHGMGMFALEGILAGEVIAKALIDGKRTPAGRYTNHHGQPNAQMVPMGQGEVDLIALKNIDSGQEITTDYYFTFQTMRGQK